MAISNEIFNVGDVVEVINDTNCALHLGEILSVEKVSFSGDEIKVKHYFSWYKTNRFKIINHDIKNKSNNTKTVDSPQVNTFEQLFVLHATTRIKQLFQSSGAINKTDLSCEDRCTYDEIEDFVNCLGYTIDVTFDVSLNKIDKIVSKK